jgi:arylsulfatase A-like enzyme
MALAALSGEQLGADAITDLLAISYSSTDILGHKMGPRALEIEDMYIRLDIELARLLTELDKSVGAGKYTLFLTADHGVVDVPAYLDSLKGSAGYVDAKPLLKRISAGLKVHENDSVIYMGDGEVFLVREQGGPLRLKDMMDAFSIVRDTLLTDPSVATVTCEPLSDLFGADRGAITDLQRNGYMPQRCGDIQYTLKPGYFEAEGSFIGKGTTHGSGWTYDTHVPAILFGQGVKPGEVVRKTAVADIVPTVCMIIGCALPDAAVGEPVPEVVVH